MAKKVPSPPDARRSHRDEELARALAEVERLRAENATLRADVKRTWGLLQLGATARVHQAEQLQGAREDVELFASEVQAARSHIETIGAVRRGKRRQREATLELVARVRPAVEAERKQGVKKLSAIVKELAGLSLPTWRACCAELDQGAAGKH